eukprot:m.151870 g.151870  ORF g.151870 m.151870 type:complete len:775 (-) comp16347_c0_seq8:1148-3472(-)
MSARRSRPSSTRPSPNKGGKSRRAGRRSTGNDAITELSVWPLMDDGDGKIALHVELSVATMLKIGCKLNDHLIIASASPPAEASTRSAAIVARVQAGQSAPAGRLYLPPACLYSGGLVHGTIVTATVVDNSSFSQLPLATRVVMELEGDALLQDRTVKTYLQQSLAGHILCKGQHVDCSLHGLTRRLRVKSCVTTSLAEPSSLDEQFGSLSLSPPGDWMVNRVIVTLGTQYELRTSTAASSTATSYTDIGGLTDEVNAVKELVDAPLRHPELFTRLGIQPPKGILLVGPPGTGKTLIARAVAHECQAHVITVSAAEVVSKVFGETEARLKAIFAEAHAQHPAVIFIDEIDALCPARDAAQQHENRVVTVLLTLMDGIDAKASQGRVVVIAATNRPDSLDAALRRPGRFDREIDIGIPTSASRLAILNVLLRKVTHTVSDATLKQVADRAHGYVGADLSAVVKEAGLVALKRQQSDTAAELSVSDQDLVHGLQAIRPSGMREVLVDVPHVRWTDIGGQEATKQQLIEAVDWPLSRQDAFAKLKIQPPRGVLLYGPPGCSKTLMAKALATESQLNFIAIKGPELFSKYVGESERAVRTVFRRARAAAPSIIFFDEIDSLGAKRGQRMSNNVADRVLSQLLTEMDGIVRLSNVTILAATNRPDLVDPALLRPGRFDRRIYVGPPDADARRHILSKSLAAMPCAPGLDISALETACDGMSGAEVAALSREAALLAMGADPSTASDITQEHLMTAIANTRKSITDEMLRFYADYNKQHA